MRRESKSTTGSVVKDKRSQTWQFFWWADGRRHSKTLGRFSNQDSGVEHGASVPGSNCPNLNHPVRPLWPLLVEHYRAERMPTRFSTRRGYESWLKCHVSRVGARTSSRTVQPQGRGAVVSFPAPRAEV
jgi:hypothetical protein